MLTISAAYPVAVAAILMKLSVVTLILLNAEQATEKAPC